MAPTKEKTKRARRPAEITSLEETSEEATLLIYSYPGVGKTALTAQLPNCLIIATEKGTVSAARMGQKGDVWKCYNWAKFKKAKEWLRDNPNHGYTWVIIDTATTLQDRHRRHIVEEAIRNGRARGDIDVPELQDYNKWYNEFLRTVDEVNEESHANVCWVAHAMEVEHDGEEMILPGFKGGRREGYQIAHSVCAKMQMIGYLYIEVVEKTVKIKLKGGGTRKEKREQREWRLLIQNTPPYVAKDRYHLGAEEIVAPNMAELSDRILEYVP